MPRSRVCRKREGTARRKRRENARWEARADTLESEISLGRVTSLIKPNLGDWGHQAASRGKVRTFPQARNAASRTRTLSGYIGRHSAPVSPCSWSSPLIGGTLINGLRWGIPFLTKVKKPRRSGHTTGAQHARLMLPWRGHFLNARHDELHTNGENFCLKRSPQRDYDKWVRYS